MATKRATRGFMKVTIHIEIGEYNKITYKKEVLAWMQLNYPHLITFDFDSHSEATVISYALDLLKQAEEIIIIIDCFPDGNSHSLLKFLDSLTRQKSKSVLVLYNGNDALIERMLSILPKGMVIRDIGIASQKEKIKDFFRLK